MLFRVVRPMKREGSRAAYFVQRIPADIRAKVVGRRLAIPVGDGVKFITPSERSQSIRFSLGTHDPTTIKILQANIAAHLETVWQALRRDDPVRLTHKQATALAGELYRARADEGRSRSITVEYVPSEGLKRVYLDQAEREAHWAAVAANIICAWPRARRRFLGFGTGVIRSERRRVSMMRLVGCPSASNSQCRPGKA